MRLIIFAVRMAPSGPNGAVNTKRVCSVCLHLDVMMTKIADLWGETNKTSLTFGARGEGPWTRCPKMRCPTDEMPID